MTPEPIRPTVLGYIWTSGGEAQAERRLLELELQAFAEREGLELAAVFSDGDEQTAGHRPGFMALLESLQTGEATGVLIPSAHHLSSHPALQAVRKEQLTARGVRLYIIRPARHLHTTNGHCVRRSKW